MVEVLAKTTNRGDQRMKAIQRFVGLDRHAFDGAVAKLRADGTEFRVAFLGLVPHEHTTGDDLRVGAITKAGNVHARWMLIETAQPTLRPPKVVAPLALRVGAATFSARLGTNLGTVP
jgi:transposase